MPIGCSSWPTRCAIASAIKPGCAMTRHTGWVGDDRRRRPADDVGDPVLDQVRHQMELDRIGHVVVERDAHRHLGPIERRSSEHRSATPPARCCTPRERSSPGITHRRPGPRQWWGSSRRNTTIAVPERTWRNEHATARTPRRRSAKVRASQTSGCLHLDRFSPRTRIVGRTTYVFQRARSALTSAAQSRNSARPNSPPSR